MSYKPKHYISDIPELMAEWNWEKNNELGLDPSKIAAKSKTKVWWKCSKGHVWEASTCQRSYGTGCPYCAKKYIIKGETDLQTMNPTLANEWNYQKNSGLTPSDVFPNSNKKVWWICRKGHEWEAKINSRNNGSGCPYCANQKVLKGYNDLATIHPDVAKEWHPIKNGKLKPTEVTVGCHTKVWWQCNQGHEWQATIVNRAFHHRGCPYCSHYGTSLPELQLLYYIKQYCDAEVIHHYKDLGLEIDIFIPSLNVGIEYDGRWFHQNKKQRDLYKNQILHNHDITLYRIRELPLVSLHSTSIDLFYNPNRIKEFEQIISELIFKICQKNVTINFGTQTDTVNDFNKMLKLCGY